LGFGAHPCKIPMRFRIKMNEEEIKNKIEEIREKLKVEVTCVNYDYYDKLLDIERKLWDLLYFKTNQEKNWLVK